MIQVIKAKKPYKPECGDLVCDFNNASLDCSSYIEEEDCLGHEKVIPLGIICPNPWLSAKCFHIDTSPLWAPYTCPYTEYKHYAILPSALLINGDVNVYKDTDYYDLNHLLDWEWHKHIYRTEILYGLTDIQKLMLGSGYTDMTRMTDGYGSIIARKAMLDNGDALLIHFWEWYNK